MNKGFSLEIEKPLFKEKDKMNIIQIVKFISIVLGLIVAIPLFIDCFVSPIISIVLIVGIYLCYVSFCFYLKRKQQVNRPKTDFIETLNKFGQFEKVTIDKSIETNEIKKLKLFNGYFDILSFDDCLNGYYNNLELKIREISLTKIERFGRQTKILPIFNGILIKLPCNKSFKGFTIINGRCDGLEKIELEDVVFSKNFNVQGSDQIEARYLLTTSFINRMMELKEDKIVQCFSLSFENGYVYIAIHTINDWFSSDTFELELNTILSIIDTLKLEQNIGM